jgi:hypothetical protein
LEEDETGERRELKREAYVLVGRILEDKHTCHAIVQLSRKAQLLSV